MDKYGNTFLNLAFSSCSVISRVVSSISSNDFTVKDTVALCYSSNSDPSGRPSQNCDSNFLNMPPCELNTFDVTGLPCLEALCVWMSF